MSESSICCAILIHTGFKICFCCIKEKSMRLEGKWNVCYIIFETESIPRFMYFKRRFSYPVFVWNDLQIAAAKTSIKLRWRHRMTPISFCAVLLAPKSTDNDYPLDSWATLNRFPPVSLFTQLYASLWWWIYLRQNIIVNISEWRKWMHIYRDGQSKKMARSDLSFSPYPTQLKTREHVLEWFGRRVVVIVDRFP